VCGAIGGRKKTKKENVMGTFPKQRSLGLPLSPTLLVAVVATLASSFSVSGEVYLPRIVSDTGTSIPSHADGGGGRAHLEDVDHPRQSHRHNNVNNNDNSDGPSSSTQHQNQHQHQHHHHHHREEVLSGDGGGGGKKKQLFAYTWGIGGARVGRPSDSHPTPPGRIEGLLPGDNVVAAAASGHTAVVTASGGLYTCGRNDSAGRVVIPWGGGCQIGYTWNILAVQLSVF
jgi:hypothetical protein